ANVEKNLAKYDVAMQSARKAVEINPNNAKALQIFLEMIAYNWRKAFDADDLVTAQRYAEQLYPLAQRVLKLNPANGRARFLRLLYLDYYDYDQALEERLAMLQFDPTNRSNLRAIIRLYQRQYQIEKLEQLLVNLADQQPDSLDLVILLSNFYSREKQYDRALQRLLPAQKRWPDHQGLTVLLAETYRLMGRMQDAIAYMQQFLDAAPEEKKWAAYQALGALYSRMGKQDQAVEAYSKAVINIGQNQPENYNVICDLAQMIFPGDQQKALDIVLPLAEEENQYAIQTMVRLCNYRGQRQEAVEWARRGVDLDPESLDARMTLAAVLLDADEPAQAQQILEEIIEQSQADTDALAQPYVMLANAHALQQDYDTAVRILERAIASGVNLPTVRFALADYYRFQGKFEQASQQYRTVLERYSGNVRAREKLAESLIRQKNFRRAEDVLEEGRRIQPKEYRWPQQLAALWLNRQDQPFEQRYSRALDFALEANTKSGNAPATIIGVMSVLNAGNQYKRCVDFYQANVPEKHKDHLRILLSLARAQSG
ncbi:MAG: tetratricopeptide repeat protein, partial [Gammaproteobacteria bacterium]|nr:tetratricopeptide repeat protein [Gammaproteobacteria bacterium]